MIPRKALCVPFLALSLSACISTSGDGPKVAALSTPSAPPVSTNPVLGLEAGYANAAIGEQERQRAYAAEVQALEYGGPGAPVGWKGDSGAYGTVIAGPAYARPGNPQCRDYSHTIYVQGKPLTTRGVACRSADGTWGAPS
ncbi:hypothetical protein GCM10007301_10960 [Azorhizobium oxalatiphilum]|uniref:Surface antigen n=1 Tax=Azorhizobium oxalatiphilum TaxID=980631 RepID=A0A917BQE6_9HYPH|nr:hypothetical protein [Azorhizobium oxalatiphilum]GGF53314.1 hypothetical protein GCM10007301_10960 [Azorhizobium oxalatiphilum]